MTYNFVRTITQKGTVDATNKKEARMALLVEKPSNRDVVINITNIKYGVRIPRK